MPTVVIADDSPTLRRIVSSVLGRSGFEVVEAEDGVQAVQAVLRTQPDAVVLDVQMPRVSGYVAARLLKDDWQTASIPVVMLTSLDAVSDRYWGAQNGADSYLTKDFQPEDLVAAVQSAIDAAASGGSGRPPLRPDPVELADDDVMSRVCELLDRKLFESSVAADVTALATTTHGFEETVAGLLGLLGRFVEYELATVLLVEEGVAYVAVNAPVSHEHYGDLIRAAADAATQLTDSPLDPSSLQPRVADPSGLLGEEPDGRMSTFLSMPLRGHGGHVLGVLALSSARSNAFGEAALATLRLVEGPAAVVVDNARLSGARVG